MSVAKKICKALAIFREGLIKQSLLVLFVSVGLSLITPIAIEQFVTHGGFSYMELDQVLRHPYDGDIYNTWLISRIKKRKPDQFPVYLLGGSSMRETFNSAESVGVKISAFSGIEVDSNLLATR